MKVKICQRQHFVIKSAELKFCAAAIKISDGHRNKPLHQSIALISAQEN